MIEIPIPPRAGRVIGSPGTKQWPGRNHPGLGKYLIERVAGARSGRRFVVADCMVGVGFLWSDRPAWAVVHGCEKEEAGVAIARANGIHAVCQRAEFWTPQEKPDLVGFSPIYPSADHDSGTTEGQQALILQKGLHAAQKLTGSTNLLRVFLQIATYCGPAPVAVIVRNWIRRGQEVDWVSDVQSSMSMAGFQVERLWRQLLPGPFAQMKLKSGKQTKWIDREWVLMGRME